jgi:DNA polymerase III sliding clamp (beta) subunit (PCNA family)
MPSGTIKLEAKPERRLVVSCTGQRTYALPTVDVELFPTPNEPSDTASWLGIEARVLASMISRVQPSIASDGRPNLEGVYLDYQDGTLNAVAVGAHTIGIVSEGGVAHEGNWAALLPQSVLKSALALCNENKIVTLAHDDPMIYIETEDTLIGSLLPRDPFVPWRNGVDSLQRTPVARVSALSLRDSLQAITVARQDRTTPISVVIEDDKMTLALVGEECKAQDQVVVEPLTEPRLRKLVNPTYLLEAVRGADATFSLEDTGSSIAISTDDYLGIVSLVSPEAWPGAFD